VARSKQLNGHNGHGNGNGHFFNSPEVEGLIARYQETGCRETLGEVIERCRPVALSLIRSKSTMRHEEVDELMSIVNGKLFRSLPSYSPERGSAFAFVSKLTTNMLATVVTHRKMRAARYAPLEEEFAAEIRDGDADLDSALAVDDLIHSIRAIRSPCTDHYERAAQRWYVESFIDAGFEMRRCECADAAMKVYGISHKRSRELYDLTLLEIRRALWEEKKHDPIDKECLHGTKGVPLLRYTNFLTEAEFTKLVILLKNLASFLVILVKPENAARIKAGEWVAVRENLELILNGNPKATPLF
jgi:hypothetical protein